MVIDHHADICVISQWLNDAGERSPADLLDISNV